MWCGWGGGLVVCAVCGVGLRFLGGGVRAGWDLSGGSGLLVVWVGVAWGDVLCAG